MVNIRSNRIQDMASTSMNPYEKQLYSVFKTFDVDNEETLDRSSIVQLCDTLQLEDRSATLVESLFERQDDRVTFTQFRNGLLTVLGSEPASHSESKEYSQGKESDRSIQLNTTTRSQSDDDSSGREVAPKCVFGSKKYGRRSRPQRSFSDESPRHRVASESRLDSGKARQRMRCKRSASAMDNREDSELDDTADLDHDRRVDRDRALTLCRGLHMHGVDQSLVDQIFETLSAQEITVGEFFERLNSSLTSSISTSLEGGMGDENSTIKSDIVPSDTVVEAWERAGVQRPKRLLLELGFRTAALRPSELQHVLDEELRALSSPSDSESDAQSFLLRASFALARLRMESAWRRLDVARAERDKLRVDLTEANRRARLLAQDVDENHARIEAELKSSLRQVEARHAETVRAAAAETAAERERAASARTALEEETARRAEVEARMRSEIERLHRRIDELQERMRAAEIRATQAEREQARLQDEAREAEGRGAGLAAQERAAVEELSARLQELRLENQQLRDRNDELCSALEVNSKQPGNDTSAAPSWREELAMNADERPQLSPKLEQCDSTSMYGKRNSLSMEIIEKLQFLFESTQMPSDTEGCAVCNNVRETIATLRNIVQEQNEDISASLSSISCAKTDIGLQTEYTVNNDDVQSLTKEIAEIKQKYEADKQSSSALIKELESSLEQMKQEYDKCEEYWTCKLDEEREVFAEEARIGDERLAELISKIGEYEKQFAPSHTLPTIDEKYSLEVQFNDLEDEFNKYKTEKEAEISSKIAEIATLKAKLEETERRQAGASREKRRETPERPLVLHCNDTDAAMRRTPHDNTACSCTCVCGRWRGMAAAGREAGALRARAARAERAAQRLHARLAAADLLVKDLYIENCRLAHLPRLP